MREEYNGSERMMDILMWSVLLVLGFAGGFFTGKSKYEPVASRDHKICVAAADRSTLDNVTIGTKSWTYNSGVAPTPNADGSYSTTASGGGNPHRTQDVLMTGVRPDGISGAIPLDADGYVKARCQP